ncbi:MAG: hypothetical protein QOJ01_1540 [Solirubrobacterales bacterium]|jgi:hypothetical protein|nr:hypothetical protein [Solirubrobacterales bacterium]
MTSDLLRIYMQDHYAGSAAGAELAKRAASNNADSELGTVLDRIAAEVEEDRDSLRRIMDEYGASPDPVKNMAAWGIEKAGRFKPNGRLLSYSPLSRVVELEGLVIGITGKLGLWRSLAETLGPHYAGEDLAELAERAEAQRQTLEPYRLAAAREAFAATVQGS